MIRGSDPGSDNSPVFGHPGVFPPSPVQVPNGYPAMVPPQGYSPGYPPGYPANEYRPNGSYPVYPHQNLPTVMNGQEVLPPNLPPHSSQQTISPVNGMSDPRYVNRVPGGHNNNVNPGGMISGSVNYNGYNSQHQPVKPQPPPVQPSTSHTNPNQYNNQVHHQTVGQQQQFQQYPQMVTPDQYGQEMNQLGDRMGSMSVTKNWSQMWGQEAVNLLTEKNIKVGRVSNASQEEEEGLCDKDIMRCTLGKVPETSSLLQKSRLPFGLLLHPFKDDEDIPVIQDRSIVRCRSCRTYINPYVRFLDQRRWQCNMCHRVNDCEFSVLMFSFYSSLIKL